MDFFSRLADGSSSTVRPVGSHRFQRVCHRSNSCAIRNLLAAESPRVSCTVIMFLMAIHDLGCVFHPWDSAQNLVAMLAIPTHDNDFVFGQRVRLSQNGVGNCDFAEVEKECTT